MALCKRLRSFFVLNARWPNAVESSWSFVPRPRSQVSLAIRGRRTRTTTRRSGEKLARFGNIFSFVLRRAGLVGLIIGAAAMSVPQAVSAEPVRAGAMVVLKANCFGCHNEEKKK